MRLQITAISTVLLLIASCAPQSTIPMASETETAEIPSAPQPQPTPSYSNSETETPEMPIGLQPQPTPSYSNEEYVPGGGFRQALDVYLPSAEEGPYPTILALHGGGFRARNKDLYAPYARHFTDQGYALVPANYRFVPENSYPAQVEDAFCALAWIHATAAEFGFDTDRIFVMGDSAGGYLAAMLGTVDTPDLYQGDCPHEIPASNPPMGVVILYGFFDLTSLEAFPESNIQSSLEPLMGGSVDDLPLEKLHEMSPMSWIDGGEPPFLVIHGTEDRTIAAWVSEDFRDALETAGVDATLFQVQEGHAFFLRRLSPNVAASLEVIDEFIADLVDS